MSIPRKPRDCPATKYPFMATIKVTSGEYVVEVHEDTIILLGGMRRCLGALRNNLLSLR